MLQINIQIKLRYSRLHTYRATGSLTMVIEGNLLLKIHFLEKNYEYKISQTCKIVVQTSIYIV